LNFGLELEKRKKKKVKMKEKEEKKKKIIQFYHQPPSNTPQELKTK